MIVSEGEDRGRLKQPRECGSGKQNPRAATGCDEAAAADTMQNAEDTAYFTSGKVVDDSVQMIKDLAFITGFSWPFWEFMNNKEQ